MDEDSTHHLFIEADNLEALKLLLKSYAGQVKMIYIDPPYNTGNDFVYSDDYSEPVASYLRRTGQAGEQGEPLTTNPRTGGRFHSNWLNMIYPRLVLARQLLRDDGVIFVSIDDNEVHHLRAVMGEVFGEENFIANMVWQSRTSISNDDLVSTNHNHTLTYAKYLEDAAFLGLGLDPSEYSNPDNDPRGPWKPVPLDANKPGGDTQYQIVNPTTGKAYLPPHGRSWSINPADYQRLLADNRIAFGKTGTSAPKRKLFLGERLEKGDTKTPSSLILDCGTTQDGTDELMLLFEGHKIFDYPKPTKLLRRLLEFGCGPNDLVLDFFAGSCTMAHAVLESNREDNGSRRYVVAQLPEAVDPTRPTGKAALEMGFSTIAEIGKERIRRVVARMKQEQAAQLPLSAGQAPEDLGFRVYRLGPSVFRPWQDYEGQSVAELRSLFDQAVSPLVAGWRPEDLLAELLLQQGYPLDSAVAPVPGLAANRVLRVHSSLSDQHLLVCLDPTLAPETVAALALAPDDVFICLDAALTDELKMRLADRCHLTII